MQASRKMRTDCPGPSWCTPGPPTVARHGYTGLYQHLGWGQRAPESRASWQVVPVHASTAAQAGVAQAHTEGSVLFSRPLRAGSVAAGQPAGRETRLESPAGRRCRLGAWPEAALAAAPARKARPQRAPTCPSVLAAWLVLVRGAASVGGGEGGLGLSPPVHSIAGTCGYCCPLAPQRVEAQGHSFDSGVWPWCRPPLGPW